MVGDGRKRKSSIYNQRAGHRACVVMGCLAIGAPGSTVSRALEECESRSRSPPGVQSFALAFRARGAILEYSQGLRWSVVT